MSHVYEATYVEGESSELFVAPEEAFEHALVWVERQRDGRPESVFSWHVYPGNLTEKEDILAKLDAVGWVDFESVCRGITSVFFNISRREIGGG